MRRTIGSGILAGSLLMSGGIGWAQAAAGQQSDSLAPAEGPKYSVKVSADWYSYDSTYETNPVAEAQGTQRISREGDLEGDLYGATVTIGGLKDMELSISYREGTLDGDVTYPSSGASSQLEADELELEAILRWNWKTTGETVRWTPYVNMGVMYGRQEVTETLEEGWYWSLTGSPDREREVTTYMGILGLGCQVSAAPSWLRTRFVSVSVGARLEGNALAGYMTDDDQATTSDDANGEGLWGANAKLTGFIDIPFRVSEQSQVSIFAEAGGMYQYWSAFSADMNEELSGLYCRAGIRYMW